MSAHSTTIVIAHYLTNVLTDCVRSVAATTSRDSVEILVVDDRPHNDGSVEEVVREYPFVRVVKAAGASGYGSACNLGVRHARGRYVVLLNNDVKVASGWLSPLIQSLESEAGTAACFPKVLSQATPGQFDPAGAGGELDVFGYPYCLGQMFGAREDDHGQYDEPRQVFWGFGGAFAAKREALLEVGGFDESFYMQMEEVDLCWRLHLQGYRVKSVPRSRVFHRGGWSRSLAGYDKVALDHRNSIRVLIKNYGLGSLLALLPFRLVLEVGAMLCGGALTGQKKYGRSVAKGLLGVVASLPRTLQSRRKVQQQRILSDLAILSRLCWFPSPLAKFLLGVSRASDLERFFMGRREVVSREVLKSASQDKSVLETPPGPRPIPYPRLSLRTRAW